MGSSRFAILIKVKKQEVFTLNFHDLGASQHDLVILLQKYIQVKHTEHRLKLINMDRSSCSTQQQGSSEKTKVKTI